MRENIELSSKMVDSYKIPLRKLLTKYQTDKKVTQKGLEKFKKEIYKLFPNNEKLFVYSAEDSRALAGTFYDDKVMVTFSVYRTFEVKEGPRTNIWIDVF